MKLLNKMKKNGFTLIELMIGMAIGLAAILIVTQTYFIFNKDKSRGVNAVDAQNNALLGIYLLENDLKNAGYGLTSNNIASCTTYYANYAGNNIPNFTIDSVLINSGVGYNGSDSITIQYGDSSNGVGGAQLRSSMTAPTGSLYVTQTFGCQTNDVVVVTDGSSCSVMQATTVDSSNLRIDHAANTAYNPPNGTISSWPAYAQNSSATCLGNLNRITYQIGNNGVFQQVTYPNAAKSLFKNVIAMKIQYGVSNSPSNKGITSWVNPTGTWASPTPTQRREIRAIRVALVAKSTEYEKTNVTNVCTNVSGNTNNGPCLWKDTATNPAPTIDLSIGDPNWQHYRYTVLSSIIPLRNIVWN